MNGGRSRGTEELGSGGEEALQPVEVVAMEGPAEGARAVLESGSILVGSGASCALRLEDSAVSREHLRVDLLPGAVRVSDLESRNGSFYLGARLTQVKVPLGSQVRVGRTTLRFEAQRRSAEASEETSFEGLLGSSLAMRKLFSLLERVAPTSARVLIQGETGTGKDGAARAIHARSERRAGPFRVFDCAAVNPNLVESELFGHARGAFTGADRERVGVLEAARGGTVLLDEVGDLPLEMQPKLLRVLEASEVRRVGESEVRSLDVRVLSATHQDLALRVRAQKFRSDLYYRLAGVTLTLPPLRERLEDIPVLAELFAKRSAKVDWKMTPQTLASLLGHSWPGNVRELRNAVERAVTLGQTETASEGRRESETFNAARDRVLRAFERDFVQSLLARNRGNILAASREAGLSRSQLYRVIDRLKLREEPAS